MADVTIEQKFWGIWVNTVADVKNWATILDNATRRQAEKLSRAPGIAGHVSLMPDAHLGRGATVGSVIPTELGTIIPAAVGVDIGCGMIAVRLNKTWDDFPEDMSYLVELFGQSIPAGVGRERLDLLGKELGGGVGKRVDEWFRSNPIPDPRGLDVPRSKRQLGTLGSGNHFVEVCVDEEHRVWVVLHSGSRGIGNNIATMFIKRAKDESTEKLEDNDLSGLRGRSFEQYIEMMEWAQSYAYINREFMMDAALADIMSSVDDLHEEQRINCHHNFAAREVHFNKEVWLTRKGAIKADVDDMGIVPGSMGTATFITKGLGNLDSYKSSAHGAGRQFSRGVAKRTFTVESLRKHMKGKAWNFRDAKALLDEHPGAYKPIAQIMEDQKDLTTVVHKLHQIVNYKGM
ncbi:MAG: RtcB family protein [SAR202 cluster bacterium]|nr:RtcB family protein [SAR202 cluster bacterium]